VSGRTYPVVVTVWVLAAILAVAYAVASGERAEETESRALPPPTPETRAAASFETDDELPAALAGVESVPVDGAWTGPGGRRFHVAVRPATGTDYRSRQIGTRTFYLPLRLDSAAVPREPCSSCHTTQGVVDGRSGQDVRRVHQNIQPVHPAATGAQCLTCHSAADPGRLALARGGTVGLNQSHELCAQCHYSRVESWSKGAHGKRLVGWRGQRVVMGCTDCHDPHSPASEQRIPMAGLSLPGELRSEDGGHEDENEGGGSHE
jgi:hypothetical protein